MGQIQLKQVTKSFGDVQVIPPLDLTIQDGEFTVFVGPSGCGKSTLLRLIAGLEDITTGTIDIDGNDATSVVPAKRGLAMVPTKFGIAFTAKYMNQGGALVHLYTDGTVLISHGGTEMGQGLHSVRIAYQN